MLNRMPTTATPATPTNTPAFTHRRVVSKPGWRRPLVSVLGSIRRHWLIALCTLAIFLVCGGYALWKKVKPIYEAHSVVYISPKFSKILASDSQVEVPYDSYVQDQIQTATSSNIIADAIAKLPYSIRHRTGPALPYEIQELKKSLEVNRMGTSNQMSIALRGPSPAGLADIVNTLTDSYVQKAKSEEFYGLDDKLNNLNHEKDLLQKQIDQSMAEQATLMQQLGTATASTPESTGTNSYESTLQKLRDQLANARTQREAAEAELDSLTDRGHNGPGVLNSADGNAIGADSDSSRVRNALNSRRATLLDEMSGLRPDHPIYRQDKQELASIEQMLNNEKQKSGTRVQDKLRQDIARARNLEQQLTQELNSKTHSATSPAPKYQRAMELGPEIGSLQKRYDTINDRIRDLELEGNSPGSIHMSTKALEPLGPEENGLILYSALLFLLSLVGAIGAAVVIDLLDNRIYTPSDVERVVGFHPLGVLLNDDEFHQDITGEYYLRLAAGIDHAVRSSGARTFLFTSPAHGSGTSTVVRKLSDKLHDLDLRTRIIVATPAEDNGSHSSNSSPRPEFVLKHKDDQNKPASLAPLAMPRTRKSQDAQAPNPMARTVHHAGDQYDVVLIDASPLPISANTEYLARVADAIVLVVKSSSTTRQELDRAARLLDRLEVAGVAVVLNKVSLERADNALKMELTRYKQSFRHP